MKLFTKYSRINLLTTIIIFLLASLVFYFFINYTITDQVDDDLKIEQREVFTYIKEHHYLPELMKVKDQTVEYNVAAKPYTNSSFKTVTLYDSVEKENGAFRELVFGVTTAGKNYKITITKSLEQTDDLIKSIVYITVGTILLILMATFTINHIVLKNLWRPFYETLNVLKTFSLSKQNSLHFTPAKVDEFAFMNHVLECATRKAQDDYIVLKKFTENASHEMQTPLAIIRSKLDLIIQDEDVSFRYGKALLGAYDAIQKLNRLNQSLLLLAKIENGQFEKVDAIHLKEKIEQKLEAFHELWEGENISITTSLYDVSVKMNNELADILLNNLLSNATRHNIRGGSINVELSKENFIISNTGSQQSLDKERLFNRFYKPLQNAAHNGLGLSIIKQICDAAGLDVNYEFTNNRHSFIITW